MAKPDTDDGWLKYAHELDAAIAVADFSKAERIVLREVLAQCFGPAKRRAALLSPTDIARRVGSDKGTVGHAIASLVAGSTLSKDGSTYPFLKDYESWTKDGKPRLSASEIAYCKGAVRHAMGFKDGSCDVGQPANEVVGQPANDVGYPTNTVGQPANEVVGQPANETLVNQPTALYRINTRPQDQSISKTAAAGSRVEPKTESAEAATIPIANQASPAELADMIAAIDRAAMRQRVQAGYPGDTGAAEDACRHAKMVASSYAPADVLAAYLSAIEFTPKPGKWASSVATALANKKVRLETEAGKIRSAPRLAVSTIREEPTLTPEEEAYNARVEQHYRDCTARKIAAYQKSLEVTRNPSSATA